MGFHIAIIAGHPHSLQQVGIAVGCRFHQVDLGIGRHGVCPFDIQRLLEFPAAGGVLREAAAGGRDHREGCRWKAELRREVIQIAGSIRVVIRIDDCDGIAATGGDRQSGVVGVAARHVESGNEMIDAGERSWRLKGITGIGGRLRQASMPWG